MGTIVGNTDARGSEYNTYAPKGHTCPGCAVVLESLELVRRCAVPSVSGPDRVTYWHLGCL